MREFGDEIAKLQTEWGAQMSAIGVGADVPLQYLDMIDNTGGAERVTSSDQLTTALLGAPLKANQVVDLDSFVNGTQMLDISIDDLVATSSGYSLKVDVAGLKALIGETNDIDVRVALQDGTIIDLDLDIPGVLPTSTVDVLI